MAYDLTLSVETWSPLDGVEFDLGEVSAGMSTESMLAGEQGKRKMLEHSLVMMADVIRAMRGVADGGVDIGWKGLDEAARIAMLRRLPASWFSSLMQKLAESADVDQEEESAASE